MKQSLSQEAAGEVEKESTSLISASEEWRQQNVQLLLNKLKLSAELAKEKRLTEEELVHYAGKPLSSRISTKCC